ncbi:unnamed protein product [Oppiella nova]|uniref:Uncharacterized protein n=1 Tax=Oppiella nova TaxID=334625 RepID=A0A7R9M834_9ACAR|nr:unnamed protein product [Oppiella nova]CAG2172556.1 unnamed protein product [Oppiella nova]
MTPSLSLFGLTTKKWNFDELFANMKELLNCFGNSSIIGTNEGITHSMSTSSSTSNTPSTASTTSSTTSSTFTTISTTSVTTIISVTTSKALPNPNDTYYEIEIPVNDTTIGVTTPPEESKGTTLSEVVLIENSSNPQNTTLKDMLHKLNQKPKDPKELTPFYVFAIILIFIENDDKNRVFELKIRRLEIRRNSVK